MHNISFYTWIHNRHFQFSRVFKLNLRRAREYDCQFVVLDVGSTDDLPKFMRRFSDDANVVYKRITRPHKLWFSRLYNEAARLCDGRILAALDADNRIGPDYCKTLLDVCKPGRFLWGFSGTFGDGTAGRNAMWAEDFWTLGGYDEEIGPASAHDIDLVERAKAYGFECVHCQDPKIIGDAIPNKRALSIKHTTLKDEKAWCVANAKGSRQSRANIAAGKLIANVKQLES